MVYFEIILRVCTGTSVFSNLIYPILFGISFGFLLTCITSLFKKTVKRNLSNGILFGI